MLPRLMDTIIQNSNLIQAGVHLFVEKPISLKSEEEITRVSEELARLEKEHDLIIAVGYMLRYSPAIQVRSFAPQTSLLFRTFLASTQLADI